MWGHSDRWSDPECERACILPCGCTQSDEEPPLVPSVPSVSSVLSPDEPSTSASEPLVPSVPSQQDPLAPDLALPVPDVPGVLSRREPPGPGEQALVHHQQTNAALK